MFIRVVFGPICAQSGAFRSVPSPEVPSAAPLFALIFASDATLRVDIGEPATTRDPHQATSYLLPARIGTAATARKSPGASAGANGILDAAGTGAHPKSQNQYPLSASGDRTSSLPIRRASY